MYGKRANDVVRFVIIQLQHGNVHCLQHLARQRKLLRKLARSRFALPFVIGKHLRAEGFAAFVKRYRQPLGLHVRQKAQQHIAKTVHSTRMHTALRRQRRQGKKRPVNQAAAIYN